MGRIAPLLLLPALLIAGAPASAESPEGAVQAAELDRAILRGISYLLFAQNEDGSWGSSTTNLHDIFAPVPGSQAAFRVASSALALSALLEVGGDGVGVRTAIARGREWLLAHHDVKRIDQITLYGIWSHAYALAAFARLHAREDDPEVRARIHTAASLALRRLEETEYVDGGWGYYDFETKSRRPGPGTTSFTSATALVGLHAMSEQGLRVPYPLRARALRVVEDSRLPSGAYLYALKHVYHPSMGVNKVKGSLARTPACLLAERLWGRPVSAARIRACLDALEEHDRFLLVARKYTRPHETWYQNSGYFCFYGYHYASALIRYLPASEQAARKAYVARTLLPLQEQDGSWWDYQLFGFHKAYGTGYVLLALGRCRD